MQENATGLSLGEQHSHMDVVLPGSAVDFIVMDPGELGCSTAVPHGMEEKEEAKNTGMKIERSLSKVYRVARKVPALG